MQTTLRNSNQRHANTNPSIRKPPQKEDSNNKSGQKYREKETKEKNSEPLRPSTVFRSSTVFDFSQNSDSINE